MRPYLYLLLIATTCIVLQINSIIAEKGKWEIILEEFIFSDIAHEGKYLWCATRSDGLIKYNKTDGSYQQFTRENGLPESILSNNEVYCIAIDNNGLKWIGSTFGIASFDNTVWTAYTSKNLENFLSFTNVAIDHNNVKWFTPDGAIMAYNDTTFSFFGYDGASDIYIDHKNIKWFPVLSYRIRYDNMEWFQYPPDEDFHFRTVAVDLNNRQFWGGNSRNGLRIYDGDEFMDYTELYGDELYEDELYACSITIDSYNIKWIGTANTLIRYDDVEFKSVFLFDDIKKTYFNILDIEIDEDGSIWFIAEGYYFANTKGILIKYTPDDSTTKVETEPLSEQITLHEARPNPFNPVTTISYEIPFDALVTLAIYDILGREISVLQDGMMNAGGHNAVWNGRNSDGELAGSGVYIYQLVAGEHKAQGKMLLLR